MPVQIKVEHFDPFLIMDSGQCFRMVRLTENTVETVALGRRVAVTALGGGNFSFDCSPDEYERLWKPYFDLDTDYGELLAAAPRGDAFLARALAAGEGLRILRQDPWETLCAFILSQRKNLGAIRACVEALCGRFGEPVEGTERKAFPTPERLAALSACEAGTCGLGYRTPYLMDAAQKVASGLLDLPALGRLPDAALFERLLSIHGVGVKVADCVMLFGYHRLSRAPVDVWIQRVIEEEYGGASPFSAFGEYAGVYQQYLFVLRRDEGRERRAQPAQCSKKTKPRAASARGDRAGREREKGR